MRINASALQAAIAAVLLSAGTARADTSPMGVWIDHTGRGAVEITDCSGKLCGYVAWVKDPKDAEGCGEQIIGDVKPIGGGKWDNGWIYDPDSDSKYDVELTPSGDTLNVMGYAGTKWLSETMTWKRAPADLQKCTKPNAAAVAPAPAVKAAAAAPAAKVEPESKTIAKAETPAKIETSAKVETPAKVEAKPAVQATSESKVAAPAKAEPKANAAKKAKKPDMIAELADSLKVSKSGSGSKRTCKMDIPYLDMAVSFPCDD